MGRQRGPEGRGNVGVAKRLGRGEGARGGEGGGVAKQDWAGRGGAVWAWSDVLILGVARWGGVRVAREGGAGRDSRVERDGA